MYMGPAREHGLCMYHLHLISKQDHACKRRSHGMESEPTPRLPSLSVHEAARAYHSRCSPSNCLNPFCFFFHRYVFWTSGLAGPGVWVTHSSCSRWSSHRGRWSIPPSAVDKCSSSQFRSSESEVMIIDTTGDELMHQLAKYAYL